MICYPWTVNWKVQGQDIEEFKYFKRWFEELGARPAVQNGMAVGRRSLGRHHQAAARGAGPHPQDALQPARPSGAGVSGVGEAHVFALHRGVGPSADGPALGV